MSMWRKLFGGGQKPASEKPRLAPRRTPEESAGTHGPKSPEARSRIAQLRSSFEGTEAILIEKGALRVRVSNICGGWSTASADVEEIPTPGLGVGLFDETGRNEARPRRWTIGGGYLTMFSDYGWVMGYGGWSLHFHPKIVKGVLDLAASFPDTMDTFERYNRILDFVESEGLLLQTDWQPVFPAAHDSSGGT